jgi:hypothetical protein
MWQMLETQELLYRRLAKVSLFGNSVLLRKNDVVD